MKKTEHATENSAIDNTKLVTSTCARAAGLRRIPRRHQTQPGEVTPRDAKVKITMFVDADVLQHFKARAARPNAAPYQTQINQALRDVMERNACEPTEDTKQDMTQMLLQAMKDERFAPAFGKYIDEHLATKK